jgi:hypothetical protein
MGTLEHVGYDPFKFAAKMVVPLTITEAVSSAKTLSVAPVTGAERLKVSVNVTPVPSGTSPAFAKEIQRDPPRAGAQAETGEMSCVGEPELLVVSEAELLIVMPSAKADDARNKNGICRTTRREKRFMTRSSFTTMDGQELVGEMIHPPSLHFIVPDCKAGDWQQ